MKKLMAVLGVSMALLAGLLIYSAFELNKPENGTQKPKVVAMVTPIAEPKAANEQEAVSVTPISYTDEAVKDMVVSEEEEQWDESVDENIAPSDNPYLADLVTHDDLSYAYSTLNDEQKTVYDEVYRSIVSYSTNNPVSTTDPATLDKAFGCVMADHPEIFYVNGYRYTKFTTHNNVIKLLVFNASYVYSMQERDAIIPDIDAVATGILMNVYEGASDYDKIKYIYDTLVLQTEYVADSPDNQNVISVLLNKKSVCQGYAKTMQLLLNRLGIPCCLVTGIVGDSQRHAWNVVRSDGDWYYVDVTWGDASYRLDEESEGEVIVPDVNYDYLLVPYDEIAKTHRAEPVTNMPDCVSMKDNYYVREGLYFTDYNPDQLRAVFDNAYATGAGYVMLKCSDAGAYNRMCTALVDEQKIFDYVNEGDIAYSNNDEMYKLLFALRR